MKTLIINIQAKDNTEALDLMKGVKKVFISEETPRQMTLGEYRQMEKQTIGIHMKVVVFLMKSSDKNITMPLTIE